MRFVVALLGQEVFSVEMNTERVQPDTDRGEATSVGFTMPRLDYEDD